MRSILWALGAAGAVYAALCAWLFVAQRSMIYFPVGGREGAPADDLRLENDAQILQIWRRSKGQSRALLYFGGNAEDVAANLEHFATLLPDHALYLVNYRGYGASTGAPSEAALYSDALRVHDHVSREHASVSVMGRSLGSGVATYLASERPVERLALITPFDSLVNVARSAYPLFPVGLLLKDRYPSIDRAARIAAPTLVVMAGRDEFIPASGTRALAERLPDARLVVIEEAGHNTIDGYAEYARALGAFFAPPERDAPSRPRPD